MAKTHVPAAVIEPAIEKAKSLKSSKFISDSIECPVGKKDAAAILGISTDSLDQWTARGLIRRIKYDVDGNPGNRGKVLYLPSDLLEFRDRHRGEGRDIEAEAESMIDQAS